MKFKEKYDINPDFEDLFSFKSKDEEIEHEAKMIMFRFLSEFERLNGKSLKKKDIAKKLETSPSYVTQLFRGDKLINLIALAKLQDAYDFSFEIIAKSNVLSYDEEIVSSAKHIQFVSKYCLGEKLYNNRYAKPDYNYLGLPSPSTQNRIAR